MMKAFIILGALCTVMSVGTDAFGAHGSEGKLSDKYIPVWEEAANYQMYYGLGLVLIGIISDITSINADRAGWLLFFGIVLFSGSLYTLALVQTHILGAIIPIEGMLLIVGWLTLIIAALRFAG